MMRKLLFTLLLHSMLVTIVCAQDRQVSGKVTSKDDGTGVPGVNVVVQGTTKGTSTDADGNYSLTLASGENTVIFSFVGFKTVTLAVDGQTIVNVELEADATALDEVVVVGYGTQREKDLTSAISKVTAEDIAKTPTSNAMQALQGKVPGVQIVSSGAPGTSPTVRVRGLGSYPKDVVGTGAENPLYVVNGVFFDNIDFLNPSDIESMSILKDASASAIYGVRAANGVILVTTKGGKLNQKAQITYDGYYGTQVAQNVLKMANAEQFTTMALESGSANDIANINNAMQLYGRSRVNPNIPNNNTDWYKEVLRAAPIQNHSISIAGGSENTTYAVGANYFAQDGIMDTDNSYERFNIRTNLDYQATSWLTVGGSVIVSNATRNAAEDGVWNQAYYAVPILPVYNPFDDTAAPYNFANAQDMGYRAGQNPFPTMVFSRNQFKTRKFLTNFYVKFNLIKENKLTFQSSYNNGSIFQTERNMDLPYNYGPNFMRNTSLLEKKTETTINQIWDNILTYNDNFGNHNVTIMAGTSFRDEAWEMLTAKGSDLVDLNTYAWYLNKARVIDALSVDDDGRRNYGLSYFGRVAYNYLDKYLVYGTFRADGSSKYQQKWGYFPSIGAGWVISEEAFMSDVNFFDFLKLRASWGKLGNDKIKTSSGEITASVVDATFNGAILSGTKFSNTYSELKWEVTTETNVGLTSRLLNNRLSVDADYYVRDTDPATIQVFPPFGDSYLRSFGIIRNQGLEMALNWSDNVGGGFRYSVGFNFATLKNSARDLGGQRYIDAGSAEFRQRTVLGNSLNAFFGYEVAGVYQTEEQVLADPIAVANDLAPGDFRYKDQNKDGLINDDDRVILGSFLPNFTYGANFSASFRNFDLSVALMGQRGNKILNRKRGEIIWTPDGNMDADLATNRWHGEGTSNEYPSSAGLRKGWNQKMSTYFVEDGSFFRIQNVQLGYNIKPRLLFGAQMPAARISFTAERPLTVFNYNGFTPEVADGVDIQTYPIPAVYTVGLNVKF